MSQRPNILYVVCHDLGQHLGCYGAPVASPNLDAFAASGIQFERAFCNSVACSPSRACAMSGQYAHISGAVGLSHMGWPLAPDVSTIIEDLCAAGYQTAHAGVEHEWHPHSGRYEVEMDRHWDDWIAGNAIDDAITFLRTRSDERPFYLNIGTQEVHASRFGRDEIVEDCYGGRTPAADTHVPGYIADDARSRHFLGGFQSAIRYLDAQFGRLLAALDTSPYADNTLVVFTTDHGIVAPGIHRSKGSLYERGVEIALLVRPPRGWPSGFRVSHLIGNIDFRPTFCELAGTEPSSAVDGHSFAPLLTDGDYQPRAALFTERNFHGEKSDADPTGASGGAEPYVDFLDPVRAVRSERFHYIRCYEPGLRPAPDPWFTAPQSEGRREEEYLFDMQQDRMQLVNLVHRSEYRHVLGEHRALLASWMRDTDDWLVSGQPPERPCEPGWGEWPVLPERVPWSPESAST